MQNNSRAGEPKQQQSRTFKQQCKRRTSKQQKSRTAKRKSGAEKLSLQKNSRTSITTEDQDSPKNGRAGKSKSQQS